MCISELFTVIFASRCKIRMRTHLSLDAGQTRGNVTRRSCRRAESTEPIGRNVRYSRCKCCLEVCHRLCSCLFVEKLSRSGAMLLLLYGKFSWHNIEAKEAIIIITRHWSSRIYVVQFLTTFKTRDRCISTKYSCGQFSSEYRCETKWRQKR